MGIFFEKKAYYDGEIRKELSNVPRQVFSVTKVFQRYADEEGTSKQHDRHQKHVGFKIAVIADHSSVLAKTIIS